MNTVVQTSFAAQVARCALALLASVGVAATLSRSVALAQNQSRGASVSGEVSPSPTGRIPEMVVYLESAAPGTQYDAPKQPIIVSQKGAQFAPSLIVVQVGSTVSFANDEDTAIEHNVYSKSDAKPFDLGLYKPGVARDVTFDKAGPIHLMCSIHKQMNGHIFVAPSPFFARVIDGKFTIENVPPGKYELKTWQRTPRFLETSQPITVGDGPLAGVRVDLKRSE
ncbi:MAG: plastocyanin/azurin family copper-binding protein [Phycisphaerae bacterium]